MALDNWSPRPRPAPDVLNGAYVRLELLDWDTHLDGLYAAVGGNASVWDYMPIGPFGDVAEFRKVFSYVSETFGWETLVIRSAGSGEISGMASYMRIREMHGSVEVGCVAFGDALKRTREATEAMYLMAAHVFDELGYRRYEWKCNNGNAASKCAAKRFGFIYEGVFRNDMVVRGENRDTAWFAMTDGDWPQIKAGFEAWLASDNFDAGGQQKTKLTINLET
jgi:RimJ/RimL family protein N-acetyltransferase